MSFCPFSFRSTLMSTAKHTADWRNRKKQQGLCPECGRNPSNNRKRCSECLSSSLHDGQQRFQRRCEQGLCGYCGKNVHETGKKSCSTCLVKRKDKYAACGDKETRRKNAAKIRHQCRKRVIEYYGGKCACCGETEILFLALDHIEGGGNEHRRQINNNPGNRCGSSSTQFYKWIEKNNYPDFLQILCHNCNMGKHLNGGKCPHEL